MSQVLPQTTVKIDGFSLCRPRLLPVMVAIVLVSSLALLFVWSRIHAINLEYEISSLERNIRSEQQVIREMTLEVAYQSRVERIERLARTKLGLRPPTPGQVIRVD